MTITTAGTAVNLAPTVTKTFFKHYYKKAKRSLKNRTTSRSNAAAAAADPHDRMNATDEFMFDEAFHIVKAFIEIGTSDTVEAIQNFTDAPAPPIPWATTLPVMIPMESCDKAAKVIVEHLGPQDLEKLVGGEKWWQLRPLPGLQGEWIAMSNDWKKMKSMEKKAAQQNQAGSAAKDGQQHSKPSMVKARRRRNKRHERALSEIRAMRQKTESALKRRSRSFKRTSQDANSQRGNATSSTIPSAEAHDFNDAASTTSTDSHVPQPNIDAAAELASDNGLDGDDQAAETEELDRLQRVMLYFHGGGYYFGSLATHRYQIVRYARKFGGKCFAPIYRKAPQYPWPCALQDAVASYLYLIDPPKGAKHTAVDPKKLVIAGDSAGGGLTLALLTVIRDMGLPAPAGAVLISPWCDMTHSFPSILQNTATDIIPPYGFIHKPSTLWPINATPPVSEEKKQEKGKTGDEKEPRRKVPVGVEEDNDDKKDDTEPAARKSQDGCNLTSSRVPVESKLAPADTSGVPPAPDLLWSDPINIHRSDATKDDIELREQIQLYATNDQLTHPLCSAVLSGSLGGLPPLYILAGDAEVLRDEIVYLAHRAAHPDRYPLRKDLLDHCARSRENAEKYDSQPTKVHLQIYDQMCHVLTAFAFTSQSRFAYRGVASFVKHVTGAPTNIKNPFPEVQEGEQGPEKEGEGDWEAGGMGDDSSDEGGDGVSDNLGGEVVSPPQASSLKSSQASIRGIEREGSSTGGMLADAITMTPSSSGQGNGASGLTALSSLGEPVNGTQAKPIAIDTSVKNGISQLRDEPEPISAVEPSHATPATAHNSTESTSSADNKFRHRSMSKVLSDTLHGHPSGDHKSSHISSRRHTTTTHSSTSTRPRRGTSDVANEYAGQVPLLRPSFQSFMIRERVDVRGYLRPLEPESSLQALRMNPDEIGRIKEGPVDRYLDGQTQWAKRFAKTAKKVEKQRAKNEQLATKMLEEAASQGLMDIEGLRRKRDVLLRNAGSTSTGEEGNTVDGEGYGGGGARGGSGLGLSAVDVAGQAEKVRSKWGWLADFGPMDLIGETPPPGAIAGRRDTDDALVLLKRSLQIRARAYGVQRKSRFWGAEDKPVRAHLRAEAETDLETETSTDPTGKTTDPEGASTKKKAGHHHHHHHHHRGLRVWNLLMVRKPPSAPSANQGKAKGKAKPSNGATPSAKPNELKVTDQS
ncbi:uncharacterized protein UTRI_01978 [Ustilago trichophora]|uniref:Alpha/beta hydrolase fold-3 domain-containing protein n=1 Tax=Ustilago trichophora TaxID=86804 RepID=A0A5C3E045_9BASI|nr:uncharacterized protein UTRI_01978 [Ustilago trichophora]